MSNTGDFKADYRSRDHFHWLTEPVKPSMLNRTVLQLVRFMVAMRVKTQQHFTKNNKHSSENNNLSLKLNISENKTFK